MNDLPVLSKQINSISPLYLKVFFTANNYGPWIVFVVVVFNREKRFLGKLKGRGKRGGGNGDTIGDGNDNDNLVPILVSAQVLVLVTYCMTNATKF